MVDTGLNVLGWPPERAAACLRGARDLRQFHDAVLASGPLPLRVLGESLA